MGGSNGGKYPKNGNNCIENFDVSSKKNAKKKLKITNILDKKMLKKHKKLQIFWIKKC
jgi:hypothetical protein